MANEAPQAGTLATMFEASGTVRSRLLAEGVDTLTRWPSEKAQACRSVKAMAMSSTALILMAEWWCPDWTCPRSLKIDLMRAEVLF